MVWGGLNTPDVAGLCLRTLSRLGDESVGLGIGRMARVLRIVRVVRLFRALRTLVASLMGTWDVGWGVDDQGLLVFI